MNFSELREYDRLLSNIAPELKSILPGLLKGTPLEKTGEVLSSLLAALESIKTGILDLSEAGNVYATNVLFRVFLEHKLKLFGIYLQSNKQVTDEFAEQYLRLSEVEASQFMKAIAAAGLDIKCFNDSPLAPFFAKGRILTSQEREKLESPFKHKKLIELISTEIGQKQPGFLSKIIPNYCQLSGFVHGGPSTSLILNAMPTEMAQADSLLNNARLVVGMFCSAKRWLLDMAAYIQPDLQSQLDEFNAAIDQLG